MGEMSSKNDAPLLTHADIEAWEVRKAELTKDVQNLQEELGSLERKLAAANVIVGERLGLERPKPEPEGPLSAEKIGDAIVRVLAPYPDGATPGEIKGSLGVSGFDMSKIEANPTYFYTTLHRLLKRKKIERRRNGAYRVMRQSSPQ
jgi:hypothetical protein